MSKKRLILYSIGGIVLIFIVYVAYTMLTTKSHSPEDVARFTKDGFSMQIEYCQPFKKGRLIFGEKESEALVPYGAYWRTGANESTEIEFNGDIQIEGNTLKAGRYKLYTIPSEDQWIVAFNSELGKWGAWPADPEKDVLRVSAMVNKSLKEFEQFTIKIIEGNEDVNIKMMWDNTEASFSFIN